MQQKSSPPPPLSLLQAGNEVILVLPGEKKISANYLLDQKGQIALPEVGLISLQGMSITEAEATLREKLSHYYKHAKQVRLSRKSNDIYIQVLGFVNKPGHYLIHNDSNIQIAINKAEGLKPGAQMDKIKLLHGDKAILVNYKQYLDSGNPKLLPKLQAGDKIFVPSSKLLGNVTVNSQFLPVANTGDASDLMSSIKVFGEVHKPGAYQYNKNMSALDYLLKAGGVTRYAGVDQIRMIDEDVPYPFNLKEFLNTGNTKYMPLVKAGATIFVPQRTEEVRSGSRTVYVMGQVQKPEPATLTRHLRR